MNQAGNVNLGHALATTTLNAVPTLVYEDVILGKNVQQVGNQ